MQNSDSLIIHYSSQSCKTKKKNKNNYQSVGEVKDICSYYYVKVLICLQIMKEYPNEERKYNIKLEIGNPFRDIDEAYIL